MLLRRGTTAERTHGSAFISAASVRIAATLFVRSVAVNTVTFRTSCLCLLVAQDTSRPAAAACLHAHNLGWMPSSRFSPPRLNICIVLRFKQRLREKEEERKRTKKRKKSCLTCVLSAASSVLAVREELKLLSPPALSDKTSARSLSLSLSHSLTPSLTLDLPPPLSLSSLPPSSLALLALFPDHSLFLFFSSICLSLPPSVCLSSTCCCL